MSDKPKIIKLEKTCDACPAQWNALTNDNKSIYIRFRWGYLSAVWVINGSVLEPDSNIYGAQVGDSFLGVMSTPTMIGYLSDCLDFTNLKEYEYAEDIYNGG